MVLTFVFFCCFVVWFLGVLDLKELPAGEWAGRSADARLMLAWARFALC
jgi:hypothetical protein